MIIDDKKKELLAKLELENEPVALKYVYAQPVGIDRYEGTGAFCELVAAAAKVNFCITGMHHGLKRRNLYAPGQHLISIPFQKMPEFFYSLEHMNWVGLFFRQDTEEARQELAEKQAKWANGGAPVLK
ncbi:MAG: hypothetical protein PUD81_03210 [Eggerthellales bacterium]|nr:hypothetical protein [Eggerthellales bacterium]